MKTLAEMLGLDVDAMDFTLDDSSRDFTEEYASREELLRDLFTLREIAERHDLVGIVISRVMNTRTALWVDGVDVMEDVA